MLVMRQKLPVTRSNLFVQINSDVIVNSHVCHSCFVNSYRRVFQRFLLGCNWNPFQTIQLVLIWSWLVFVLVWLTYFDYNLFCSLSLCLLQFLYSLSEKKYMPTHTDIYVCMCVYVYYIYICVCVCVCIYICVYVYYVCVYVCVCLCVNVCMCTYVYIYMYIYIYIYVCVYIYIKKAYI